MKKYLVLLFITFIGFEISFACTCKPILFENRIKQSQFIFTGKVISIQDIYADSSSSWPTEQVIKLEVLKLFKGNKNDTLTVKSGFSSCSYLFEKNKSYLVFAGHLIGKETNINQAFIDLNDRIVTSQCSGNSNAGSPYFHEKIRKLEKLFSAGLPIKNISPDQLYNEIWKEESFIFTDEYPEFPSGLDSIDSFMQRNLNSCSLPDERPNSSWDNEMKDDSLYKELNMDFEPREPTFVLIHFDVSKTGVLSNFIADRHFSLNAECDGEAIRVAKLMPDWIPAKIKEIPVNSSFTIQIDFKSKTAY